MTLTMIMTKPGRTLKKKIMPYPHFPRSEDEVHSGNQERRNSSQEKPLEEKTDRPTVRTETISGTSEHEDTVCDQSPAGELVTLSFISYVICVYFPFLQRKIQLVSQVLDSLNKDKWLVNTGFSLFETK